MKLFKKGCEEIFSCTMLAAAAVVLFTAVAETKQSTRKQMEFKFDA